MAIYGNEAGNAPSAGGLRWLALVVLCAGGLMMVLDTTIVNVALPSIKRDLGFSQSNLAWVVDAYLIPYGGLMLLAGRLGDLMGRKRVLLIGLSVFTAASLLGGLSGSQGMLVGARLVQGIGAAMTMPVILGIIVTIFSDPRERARAIAAFSGTTATGASIGLLVGGLLTQTVTWHWIFYVNLPIGFVVAVLAQRLVASDPGIGRGQGPDVAGAVLVTSALMLGVYTIVETTDFGWGSARTVGLGAGALLMLSAFLVRQARASSPLLPLGLFRSRNLSGANVVQALMLAGLFGMFFLGALYLQGVLGYGPIQIGLAFLPLTVFIGLFDFGFAQLSARFGARAVLAVGLALIVGGLLLLARIPVAAHYAVDLLLPMVLMGVGFGLTFPATMTLGTSGATASDSGLVSGLLQTSSQVGGSLGLAVLAALSASRTNYLLALGQGRAAAFTDGYHLAFAVAAGVVGVAVVVTVTVLRSEHAAIAQLAPGGPP